MYEVFNSIEDVWAIWLISLLVLGFWLRRVLRRFNWKSARRFAGNESGASYALPYVMTFPFFLLLMALLMQATFIIMVKIGTMYAAYSSARTFIVWQSVEPKITQLVGADSADYIRYKTHRAAMMAMAPFANSNRSQRKSLFPLFPLALKDSLSIEKGGLDFPVSIANLLSNIDAVFYVQAYDRLVADASAKDTGYTHPIISNPNMKGSSNYLKSKYAMAAAATRLTTPSGLVPWNQDVNITVRYRMSFHIPAMGPVFLGKRRFWSSVRFRDVETTYSMPSEAAETPDGKIGIPYNIFLL